MSFSASFAQSVNDVRTSLIIDAFNSHPDSIIKPLDASSVELGTQDGRVNVNQETKFSYYVHIENSTDAKSRMVLIPMATSRFTATYYQTDDWWNKNKAKIDKAKAEGRPAPRQEMSEVAEWLTQMKLTTNPDVIVIDPLKNLTERSSLQKFLLDHYLRYYAKDGYITLFRGAEKVGEISDWARGQTPRGVRYWTPTANYAWRYARKNFAFLDDLLADKTPLFKFKVPVSEFKDMVERRWQHLVLGTELTKNAHQSFNSSRQFQDHLANQDPYMGEGRYGVEFELRSNRTGAERMTGFYQGPVTIQDLVSDRIAVLERTKNRLSEKNPETRVQIEERFSNRIRQVEFEGQVLTALKENYSNEAISQILAKKPAGRSEIGYIDSLDFGTWAQKKMNSRPAGALKTFDVEAQIKEIQDKTARFNPLKMKCEALFL